MCLGRAGMSGSRGMEVQPLRPAPRAPCAPLEAGCSPPNRSLGRRLRCPAALAQTLFPSVSPQDGGLSDSGEDVVQMLHVSAEERRAGTKDQAKSGFSSGEPAQRRVPACSWEDWEPFYGRSSFPRPCPALCSQRSPGAHPRHRAGGPSRAALPGRRGRRGFCRTFVLV